MAGKDQTLDYNPARSIPENGPLYTALLSRLGYNPTDGMSPFQRFAAGAGQGMTQASLAGRQALANANPLSLPPAIMDKAIVEYAARARDKKMIDSPLLATGAGQAGSLAGQAAVLATLR